MTYLRYDVYNPRIYGPETKHDVNVVTFIARHHLVLQRIVAEGGGKLLCQLWDNEVAECRRSIRQVESYPLTKHRPENCGQRASSAVLGCLRLEQQNSWNLALQNVEQLKWILSQTGGDGEETNHSCPPLSPASSCA